MKKQGEEREKRGKGEENKKWKGKEIKRRESKGKKSGQERREVCRITYIKWSINGARVQGRGEGKQMPTNWS